MEKIKQKLKRLKDVVRQWISKRKLELSRELVYIERTISNLIDPTCAIFFVEHTKIMIIELLAIKDRILKLQEEHWRMKSKVAWVIDVDRNTNFFLSVDTKRKQLNTIWNIINDAKNILSLQKDI